MDTSSPQSTPVPAPPANLYEYALAQVKAAADRRELTRDTKEMQSLGIDVSMSWLNKFATDKIPGAGYAKVHAVATFYMEREASGQQAGGLSS